jgi:Zn-dependent protease
MSSLFIMKAFTEPGFYVAIVVIMMVSISLHELGHGLAALSQGDDTPRQSGHMTLNPVVHMGMPSIIFLLVTGISWGQMPVNPARFRSRQWGDFIVSIAGPLTNLLLAAILVVFIRFNYQIFIIDERYHFIFSILSYAAARNAALFLLNMIPIPPLDGFYVFSKFFPELSFFNSSNGQQYSQGLLMLIFIVGGEFLYAGANFIVEWMMTLGTLSFS